MHKCIPFGSGALLKSGVRIWIYYGAGGGAFLKTLVASSTFLAGFGKSYMAGYHEAGRPAGWAPGIQTLTAWELQTPRHVSDDRRLRDERARLHHH